MSLNDEYEKTRKKIIIEFFKILYLQISSIGL
jgi:hypothetical protein